MAYADICTLNGKNSYMQLHSNSCMQYKLLLINDLIYNNYASTLALLANLYSSNSKW